MGYSRLRRALSASPLVLPGPQRDVNLEVPTITLTEKQIEARKQREREDIEREKQIS
jgi:hypothetical protein